MLCTMQTGAGILPLEALLETQQGVVARAQLLTRGVDDTAISRRVRRGDWQRLVPGIYVLSRVAPSTEQRRTAAALYAGEHASSLAWQRSTGTASTTHPTPTRCTCSSRTRHGGGRQGSF